MCLLTFCHVCARFCTSDELKEAAAAVATYKELVDSSELVRRWQNSLCNSIVCLFPCLKFEVRNHMHCWSLVGGRAPLR